MRSSHNYLYLKGRNWSACERERASPMVCIISLQFVLCDAKSVSK